MYSMYGQKRRIQVAVLNQSSCKINLFLLQNLRHVSIYFAYKWFFTCNTSSYSASRKACQSVTHPIGLLNSTNTLLTIFGALSFESFYIFQTISRSSCAVRIFRQLGLCFNSISSSLYISG